jgi:hypothetical protein
MEGHHAVGCHGPHVLNDHPVRGEEKGVELAACIDTAVAGTNVPATYVVVVASGTVAKGAGQS